MKPKDKGLWSVKIGERGQFVIPKEAREMFDFKPGDTILVLADKDRGLAIPPPQKMNEIVNGIFENDPDAAGRDMRDFTDR